MAMSISQVETRIQACRQAVGQLQEMLRMDFSQDLCPMVDILVGEARDEVGHLQQAGEVCLAEGRFDLVEQHTGMASELEDIQRRAELWKAGGGQGGPGGARPMSDDERMARELAAQFEEGERVASQQGTPAASMRSHRSTREEEDERFARELATAEGHSVPAPQAPVSSGPPVLAQAPLGGMPTEDRASEGGSDPGRFGRKKEKKKKREKEDAWGGDGFGGTTSDGGGFGAGWPGGGTSTDAAAVAPAGGFQADFGAFGGGGGGWADSSPPAFPQASGTASAFGETAPPAQDFGAFGGGSTAGFPSDGKPTASAFGGSDTGGFPAAADGVPMPSRAFAGGSPGADLGAFQDVPDVDAAAALPESPAGLPPKVASQASWGGSSGTAKHAWGPQAMGETVTMHIRRPFAEIADNMDGFTDTFVHSIARAMGISEHRIRVQAVRPS